MTDEKLQPYIKKTTLAVIAIMLIYSLAEALFPLRTFWNDEWRLIYNVKFKSVPELWGRLDLLQECPRVLLTVLKYITQQFDYSYASLRLPALVLSFCNILLAFHLRKRLFSKDSIYGYLFVLIIVGSETFVRYLVQFKHYEMDFLLCLTGIWQLITLLDVLEGKKLSAGKWALILISFCAAPYFSYVYPIVVTPIYGVLLFAAMFSYNLNLPFRRRITLAVPLALCAINIVIFYFIDVQNMLGDQDMYQSYREMLKLKEGENPMLANFWYFFALVGAGALFEIIFGIVGIAAFGYGVYKLLGKNTILHSRRGHIVLYAMALIVITLGLVFSGKLMGGVGRLVSFTVPSLAFLIALSLEDTATSTKWKIAGRIAFFLVLAGACGNIITNGINTYAYPQYKDRITTFKNTGKALREARANKVPLLFTMGMMGDPVPDTSQATTIRTHTIDASQIRGEGNVCPEVVVRVNPEYKVWDTVALYEMPGYDKRQQYVQQLPSQYQASIVSDGIHWELIKK